MPGEFPPPVTRLTVYRLNQVGEFELSKVHDVESNKIIRRACLATPMSVIDCLEMAPRSSGFPES